MIITTYELISDSNTGFYIQNNNGKSGNKKFDLWFNTVEGVDACQEDFDYIDTFDTEKDALNYIKTEYGEIKKIKIY